MSHPPSPARLREIDRAFDAALDVPTELRADYVAGLARHDPPLATAVDELLRAGAAAGPLAAPLTAVPPLATPCDPEPGSVVGRYRLIREIGRGGMAVVHLAERIGVGFAQHVALKRLRHELAGPRARERFEHEQQILAGLSHPSIARLLDGGVDAAGFPFLVMEYCDGRPIDRHADAHALPLAERLTLFVAVAQAVDHAHRHLVVHRDLKPSNIVVTSEGAVKLLDFGIARALDDAPAATTDAAPTAVRALTPEYASPEQLAGERAGIPSDVYQLGLLLHELLCGVRARPIAAGSWLDAAAACRAPFVPPSAALAAATDAAAIARARATTPAALARRLRGDLDNIVATAARVDPAARYPTAAALADDVERHLSGHAVRARGDAPLYRVGRFVRRHALAVGAAAAIAALVLAIAVVESVQATRLAAERDRVRVEAAKARGVTDFLLGLFEIPPSAEADYANLTAREVLEYRAAHLDDLAGQPPVVRAEVLATVGRALIRLGAHLRGHDLAAQSLALRREALGDDHLDTAESRFLVGAVLNMQGRHDEARAHLEPALAVRERRLGADHADVAEALAELATSIYRLGDVAAARPLLLRALDIDRRAGSEHEARVLNALGMLSASAGDDDDAARYFGEAIAYRRARFAGSHPDLPTNLENLAGVHLRLGAPDRAVPLLIEAHAGRRRIFGDAHRYTLGTQLRLAAAHLAKGDHAAAERVLREVERLADPGDEALRARIGEGLAALAATSGAPVPRRTRAEGDTGR